MCNAHIWLVTIHTCRHRRIHYRGRAEGLVLWRVAHRRCRLIHRAAVSRRERRRARPVAVSPSVMPHNSPAKKETAHGRSRAPRQKKDRYGGAPLHAAKEQTRSATSYLHPVEDAYCISHSCRQHSAPRLSHISAEDEHTFRRARTMRQDLAALALQRCRGCIPARRRSKALD